MDSAKKSVNQEYFEAYEHVLDRGTQRILNEIKIKIVSELRSRVSLEPSDQWFYAFRPSPRRLEDQPQGGHSWE